MIIEKTFSKFAVFTEDSILSALHKINANQSRVVFAVSEGGVLEGSLSDGDVRRWLTATPKIDLETPVADVMNRQFRSLAVDAPPEAIRGMLSNRVLAVPLLDGQARIVAVALPQRKEIEIEGRIISENSSTFLIAEIGNNHNGDLLRAIDLIDAAAESGADCAKFQMRDLASLYRNAGNHEDASADLGAQYTLDLLSRFQLSDDELMSAFDHCRKRGIVPLCTPWDHISLRKLESYGLSAYKVASADFTNFDLIDEVVATKKPLICSTGMATERDIGDGIRHLQSLGAPFILLHCNSTYPAPFKDVNLRYMEHLRALSGGLVGYSGHERDIHVAIAAVAIGAKIIEKHFTLDRSMEGNDHKVSLLPHEFQQMSQGIRQVEQSLGHAGDRVVSQGEMMNRETLAKSLVASKDIPAGTIVTAAMVAVQSPGQGLQPNRKAELVGRILSVPKSTGDFFYPSDLGDGQVVPRHYQFPRAWGIPVRYHDWHRLSRASNPSLVEIHLSYKDLDLDFRKYISEPTNLALVIHAPELFAGDHTLDLCSADPDYRARSLRELQRVIDLTREIQPFFPHTERPCIVTNVGGFSTHRHLNGDERSVLYEQLATSLSMLDQRGVEVIPQTMPPFPWHFGGQQFHNLFVDAEAIAGFCSHHKMRVCLDVSHSKLACNHLKHSFSDFLRRILPHTAHLHLADAAGVDGEGLQIGEGEIDWREFWDLCDSYTGLTTTFIPEIWQGHKNDGEGAWRALDLLENALAPSHRVAPVGPATSLPLTGLSELV